MHTIQRPRIESTVLLVEGQDDRSVIKALYKKAHEGASEPPFSIRDLKGIENIFKGVGGWVKKPRMRAIGIVMDANSEPIVHWNRLKKELEKEGIIVPLHPKIGGTIVRERTQQPRRPRVGIWMMPDNCSSGDLESFFSSLISKSDRLWPRISMFIDQVAALLPIRPTKAKVRVWLALRKRPLRLAQAITFKQVSPYSQVSREFLTWLDDLFR